jgi:transposase
MPRYYLGVDWGDRVHQLYGGNENGTKVMEMKLQESPEGVAELGRWLDQSRAEDVELWAAIEKPHGRIVDFLLDHGVVVYPVNPKVLDRARDRFRMSQSKSDPFDAWVLSEFLRTDHGHLRPLAPNSEQAQELKMLTRDQQRMVRHKTRLLNQLKITLKEYYPRAVEVFADLESGVAVDFLKQYSTPTALSKLSRKQWSRFTEQHPHLGQARSTKLWEELKKPQLMIPDHVIRAKAQLLEVLLDQLEASLRTVEKYSDKIERFFASTPAARLVEKLPGGKSGTLLPMIWAELGDAPDRWQSFKHLQAEAGAVPVTKSSGKSRIVEFRFSCNKQLRYAVYWFAFISINRSEWAKAFYRDQRARGHSHPQALRALGAKWLKIIFVMWRDHKPYDETHHLANIARQKMRQAA